MKIPLYYQMTKHDCATTSILNALSYSLDNALVKPNLIHGIWNYSLDYIGGIEKEIGSKGTTNEAMRHCASFINNYCEMNGIDLRVLYFEKEEVCGQLIEEQLRNKRIVIMKCYQRLEHYVLITSMHNDKLCLWDPWIGYESEGSNNLFLCDYDHPYEYNRIIDKFTLFGEDREDFSLVDIQSRSCMVFYHID